jgi:hypothetical protein
MSEHMQVKGKNHDKAAVSARGGHTRTVASQPKANQTARDARAQPFIVALKALPDARADAVAHARRLISNADYPGADIIQRLARLLVPRFEAEVEAGKGFE